MNTPYDIDGLNLSREDRIEWFRYQLGNKRARRNYYARRDYIETLKVCLVCDHHTRALDSIHATCKSLKEHA